MSGDWFYICPFCNTWANQSHNCVPLPGTYTYSVQRKTPRLSDFFFSVDQEEDGDEYRYFVKFKINGKYHSFGGVEESPKRCYEAMAAFMVEAFKWQPA